MQLIILISILLITLIFLHIKESPLVFQKQIKTAKLLSIIVLVMILGANNFAMLTGLMGVSFLILLYNIVIWILICIAYTKLFSGCYRLAIFNKIAFSDTALRAKIKGILFDVIEKRQTTDEYEMFINVNYKDAVVEEVRSKCENIWLHPSRIKENRTEDLKLLIEKLDGSGQ